VCHNADNGVGRSVLRRGAKPLRGGHCIPPPAPLENSLFTTRAEVRFRGGKEVTRRIVGVLGLGEGNHAESAVLGGLFRPG